MVGSPSRPFPQLPTTAFGELSIAHNEPQFSVINTYGIDPQTTKQWIGPSGGSITASSTTPGMVEVASGTSSGTTCAFRSQKALFYRPGRGAILRLTGMFATPVTGNRQLMGALSFLNGFAFGYDENGQFGICHKTGGKFEIWALTITGAAAGAETATITIDGVAYNVTLSAGTTAFSAAEIQASLQSQLASLGYIVTHTGSVVKVARVYTNATLGTMAYASDGTSTGSWSHTATGVQPTYTWVPQDRWNGEKVAWLQPQYGNVYEISFQYLGFGDIFFRVVEPGTGDWITVHTIQWGGRNSQMSLSNPNLFATWEVDNVTNSSAVTMYAGCAFGAVQGDAAKPSPVVKSFSKSGVATTETYLGALRCDIETNGTSNQSSFRLVSVHAASDSPKGIKVKAYKYATLTNPQWVNMASTNQKSIVSYDTSATAFATTNAFNVMTFNAGATGSQGVLFEEGHVIPVFPNETIVFVANVLSGAASQVDVSVRWDEQR